MKRAYLLADDGLVRQWAPLGFEDRFECKSLYTKSIVDRYIQLLHAQPSLSVYQFFESLQLVKHHLSSQQGTRLQSLFLSLIIIQM